MTDTAMPAAVRRPLPWRVAPPARIGEFEVRAASNELIGPAGALRLRPRLMDVLLRLAAASGDVVARETLLADVWPRRMVADEVLSRTIAELRTALGDDAKRARYIETVPTVGYRLVAPLGELPPAGPGPTPGADDVAQVAPRRRVRPAAVAVALLATIAVAVVAWRALVPDPVRALERRLAGAMPLTADPDLEVNPRFSPDGRRVAFAAGAQGTPDAHVVIVDVDGGSPKQTIGNGADSFLSPVFFPDGKRIAYAHCVRDDCAIVSRDLASGSERTLVAADARPLPQFDIAPDGRSLVHTSRTRAQQPRQLMLVDLGDGTSRPLTAPEPGMGNDRQPRFSPDGTRIAFFRGNDSLRRLWTLEVAAPERAAPTAQPRGQAYGAAWLDNQSLLVSADWFGFRALNYVDVAKGRAVMVGARGARNPDVSRGGAIVYENATFRADLWAIEPAQPERPPAVLWPSTRYTNQPEFAPDGKRLVFVSNRDGAEALYVGKPGGDLRRLAGTDGFRYIRPHWSHDGRAVYAVRVPIGVDSAQHAVRIGVDDGRIDVLDALGDRVFDVRDDAGGRFVFFGMLADNAVRLFRAPQGDLRAHERLPLPIVSEYATDAARLAFTQPQLDGLTVCTLPALVCTANLPLPIGDGNRFDWTLANGAVYFLDRATTPATLARYDTATQLITWRSPFTPTGFGRSIAVAADGSLVVGREAPAAIDLMLAR